MCVCLCFLLSEKNRYCSMIRRQTRKSMPRTLPHFTEINRFQMNKTITSIEIKWMKMNTIYIFFLSCLIYALNHQYDGNEWLACPPISISAIYSMKRIFAGKPRSINNKWKLINCKEYTVTRIHTRNRTR